MQPYKDALLGTSWNKEERPTYQIFVKLWDCITVLALLTLDPCTGLLLMAPDFLEETIIQLVINCLTSQTSLSKPQRYIHNIKRQQSNRQQTPSSDFQGVLDTFDTCFLLLWRKSCWNAVGGVRVEPKWTFCLLCSGSSPKRFCYVCSACASSVELLDCFENYMPQTGICWCF